MTEKAYAKLNLTLEVIGKKNNYHQLESIIIPINIYDTLKFVESTKDEVISNVYIKDNNIYKALKLFKETFKITSNVKIILDKKIPIGYGLGGSSADISATLRGLNAFFNLNKSLKDLEEIALKLGSDTLFCLYQKRALITGRGEFITFKEKKEKDNYLLILPSVSLLTKDVFSAFNFENNYIDFKTAFNNDDYNFINTNAKNDLFKPALRLNNNLKQLYKILNKNKIKTNLTGSGPALFIVNPTTEIIKKVKQLLNKNALYILTEEI